MSFDLLPRRKTNLDTVHDLPLGMTHATGTPCPFAPGAFPTTPTGTCCSFDGQVLIDNLRAFGETQPADVIYDVAAEGALLVANLFRMTASGIERRYRGMEGSMPGTSMDGMLNFSTGEFTPWPKVPIEEAIASIRKAAVWYEVVGRLGFDVHVRR